MNRTAADALAKFWQMPAVVRMPREREWVYFLEADTEPVLVKIGKSRDLKWRLLTLQGGSPVALKLIGAVSAPAGTERVLHVKWKSLRSHGEWFLLTEYLRQFIAALPKGESLPPGAAERWSSETGEPLESGKTTPQQIYDDLQTSRHWNREFRDP